MVWPRASTRRRPSRGTSTQRALSTRQQPRCRARAGMRDLCGLGRALVLRQHRSALFDLFHNLVGIATLAQPPLVPAAGVLHLDHLPAATSRDADSPVHVSTLARALALPAGCSARSPRAPRRRAPPQQHSGTPGTEHARTFGFLSRPSSRSRTATPSPSFFFSTSSSPNAAATRARTPSAAGNFAAGQARPQARLRAAVHGGDPTWRRRGALLGAPQRHGHARHLAAAAGVCVWPALSRLLADSCRPGKSSWATERKCDNAE